MTQTTDEQVTAAADLIELLFSREHLFQNWDKFSKVCSILGQLAAITPTAIPMFQERIIICLQKRHDAPFRGQQLLFALRPAK